MANDKLQRLKVYAEGLENRLKKEVPAKHQHRPEIFRDMIRRDLEKTKLQIAKLSG